ncbi:MAG: AIR synthase-related protein [Planctomycetota bacterium]
MVFERLGLGVHDRPAALGGRSVAEALLAPHRPYLKPLWPQLEAGRIAAMAHITGGGLIDNLPRILGECDAVFERAALPRVPLFDWLVEEAGIDHEEAYRVFNMGVGMVLCVDPADADQVQREVQAAGEEVWRLGVTTQGSGVVQWS